MRNIALILTYVGTAYHGWQVQPKDITVEDRGRRSRVSFKAPEFEMHFIFVLIDRLHHAAPYQLLIKRLIIPAVQHIIIIGPGGTVGKLVIVVGHVKRPDHIGGRDTEIIVGDFRHE